MTEDDTAGAAGKHGAPWIGNAMQGDIACDDATHGRLPLLVVGDHAMSWDALGEVRMRHEGWRFKLELIDPGT